MSKESNVKHIPPGLIMIYGTSGNFNLCRSMTKKKNKNRKKIGNYPFFLHRVQRLTIQPVRRGWSNNVMLIAKVIYFPQTPEPAGSRSNNSSLIANSSSHSIRILIGQLRPLCY